MSKITIVTVVASMYKLTIHASYNTSALYSANGKMNVRKSQMTATLDS